LLGSNRPFALEPSQNPVVRLAGTARTVAERLHNLIAQRRQCDFAAANIDLRLELAKISQSSICRFSIRRLQRIAKQLAVDADIGKIDARCRWTEQAGCDSL